ncbi:MAG: hypothetical protein ACI81T_003575, partial [Bacteroidia bacterium]
DFQYEKKCFFYVFRVNPCAKSVWVSTPIPITLERQN